MNNESRIVVCRLPEVLPLLSAEPEVYLVYDEQVAWVAGELLSGAGESVRGAIAVDTSEALKTMDTVLAICRQLLEAGASRKALVLAIGGGITTDMAGFAASIYKRGIRYANLPTTLLAQVDAAIGGKTGVNLDGYKNMLGAFQLPVFTALCPEVLGTLPLREIHDGLAELLKTFLIGDAPAYEALVAASPSAGPEWGSWARRAAEIKAGIVQRDPLEQGERAVLNLGHTFGHAIEHEAQRQGDDIHHGEAVAMGIILAARLSEALGVAQKGLAARLKADFEALGLPVESPYPLDALQAAMEKDKKAAGGKVNFVLLQAPGKVVLRPLTPAEACNQLNKP